MPYLILLIGLILTFLAAFQLQNNHAATLEQTFPVVSDLPLTGELVSPAELGGAVEAGLLELEEIKQRLQYLLTRQEKQQEAVEKRLLELEKLLQTVHHAAAQSQPGATSAQRRPQQEVYQLAEQGLSVAEIAAQLELGRGEVELILGWRKSKN